MNLITRTSLGCSDIPKALPPQLWLIYFPRGAPSFIHSFIQALAAYLAHVPGTVFTDRGGNYRRSPIAYLSFPSLMHEEVGRGQGGDFCHTGLREMLQFLWETRYPQFPSAEVKQVEPFSRVSIKL